MISLVEEALDANGMANAYVRLDGSLPLPQRDRVLRDFKSENSMQREMKVEDGKRLLIFPSLLGLKIMLISLKAGGVGLNLTHANNVFLLDPWYIPCSLHMV